MKIVVTGSLGNIGKPLVNRLVRENNTVLVISSSPGRKQEIEATGANAAIGSLEDPEFVTSAFTDADAVFAMVPANFSRDDQVAYYRNIAENYAQAIQKWDVRRVVHLSSYRAHLDKDTGFILGSHHAENILDELTGVNITHLRPGYFYHNLFGFIDMIKEQGFIAANYGGNDKMILVHPKDIAAAAAEEMQRSPGNKIQYVVSDECTADEVAQILGAAIGKPGLGWKTLTDKQAKKGMEANGIPVHVVDNFAELGAALHSGTLLEGYEQQAPIDMGNVKVGDFAEEFAAAYNNS